MNGEVKFFNQEKGFGFIKDEEGKEYFFHISAIAGETEPKEAQKVTFEIEQGDRGPKAVQVELVSGDDAAASEE